MLQNLVNVLKLVVEKIKLKIALGAHGASYPLYILLHMPRARWHFFALEYSLDYVYLYSPYFIQIDTERAQNKL